MVARDLLQRGGGRKMDEREMGEEREERDGEKYSGRLFEVLLLGGGKPRESRVPTIGVPTIFGKFVFSARAVAAETRVAHASARATRSIGEDRIREFMSRRQILSGFGGKTVARPRTPMNHGFTDTSRSCADVSPTRGYRRSAREGGLERRDGFGSLSLSLDLAWSFNDNREDLRVSAKVLREIPRDLYTMYFGLNSS